MDVKLHFIKIACKIKNPLMHVYKKKVKSRGLIELNHLFYHSFKINLIIKEKAKTCQISYSSLHFAL